MRKLNMNAYTKADRNNSEKRNYTVKLHKNVKLAVDKVISELQSVASASSDSDVEENEHFQTIVKIGPFRNVLSSLGNNGVTYLAKSIQMISISNPKAAILSLKHIDLSNQKIGWKGLSTLSSVLSNSKFSVKTFDFQNNNLFPNKATVDMINNVSAFLMRDTLIGLTLSNNTLITFDKNKLPSLSWLLFILSSIKHLKILRLQNRLTKNFKLALGNILLDKCHGRENFNDSNESSASGLFSSFVCSKFSVSSKETNVAILPSRNENVSDDGDNKDDKMDILCNSEDIVLLAGILTNHKKIRKLAINKQSINSIGAGALSKLIRNNQHIVELNLKFSTLGDLGLKVLLHGLLSKKSNIQSLNIASTKVTEVGLDYFSKELCNLENNFCKLAYLTTSSFQITSNTISLSMLRTYRESDIILICALLSLNNNKQLKILNIRNIKVHGKREVEIRKCFSTMIRKSLFLKILNIADTVLDANSGNSCILGALEDNLHLTNVIISRRCSNFTTWANAITKQRKTVPVKYENIILLIYKIQQYSFETNFSVDLIRYILKFAEDERVISFPPKAPTYFSSGGP